MSEYEDLKEVLKYTSIGGVESVPIKINANVRQLNAQFHSEQEHLPEFRPDIRQSILQEASSLINGPREATYGHPKENLKRIATLWNAYLQAVDGRALMPKDVAMMMALLKMARLAVTSMPMRDQHDSVVDMAGYVGLIERVEE